MFVTKATLGAMGLCGNHWAHLAQRFVGERRQVTFGNVVLALEAGIDLSFFVDYWTRENAGGGRKMGDTGKVAQNLLEIYQDMWEGLAEVRKGDGRMPLRRERHLQEASRASVFLDSFERLYYARAWTS